MPETEEVEKSRKTSASRPTHLRPRSSMRRVAKFIRRTFNLVSSCHARKTDTLSHFQFNSIPSLRKGMVWVGYVGREISLFFRVLKTGSFAKRGKVC